MESDQDRNCLLCEIVLPEYEDKIIQQALLIKQLQQTIEDLKNDNDGKRHGAAV